MCNKFNYSHINFNSFGGKRCEFIEFKEFGENETLIKISEMFCLKRRVFNQMFHINVLVGI